MEFWSPEFCGAFFVGAVAGFVPLIVGAFRGQPGYGIFAFFGCILAGLLGGILLAAPACALGIADIVRRSKRAETTPHHK